jgi:hypothetical protein
MVLLDLKVDSNSIRSHRESPELVQIVRAASQEYRLEARTASQIILIVKPSNFYRLFIQLLKLFLCKHLLRILFVSFLLFLHFFFVKNEVFVQSLEYIIESHLDCFSFLLENLSLELNLPFSFFEFSNLSIKNSLPIFKKTFGSLQKCILFFLFLLDYLVFNLGIVNSCSKLFKRE